MRVLELNAVYLGVGLETLMENAGIEVSRLIISHHDVKNKRIGIICGVGGNGGDGFVAARHLQEAGANVEVLLVGDPNRISSQHTLRNWKILENLQTITKKKLMTETEVKKAGISSYDILVDGLLGFGLTSDVREPVASAIKIINKSAAVKYSIDIPSGMDSDTGKILGICVRADHTITMHAPKPGLLLNKELVGSLHIASIGIPNEANHVCGFGDIWLFNRPRRKDSHKGDFGRVLVIGGSDVFAGAPALAGMAALRAGVDLVSIMAPETVAPAIRSYSPNLMVHSTGTRIFDESCFDFVLDNVLVNDVIAIGPGLGTTKESKSFFRKVIEGIESLDKQMVIDADGLKALAETEQSFNPDRVILTPHWGELQILLQKKIKSISQLDERLEFAVEAAEKYQAIVLLKGAIDVVASPNGRYKFNRTGHPAMTVGGTGDVLTGITAAFLAQKKGAFNAAAAAAYVSGLAGELAAEAFCGRILATDCIEKIPIAMK